MGKMGQNMTKEKKINFKFKNLYFHLCAMHSIQSEMLFAVCNMH